MLTIRDQITIRGHASARIVQSLLYVRADGRLLQRSAHGFGDRHKPIGHHRQQDGVRLFDCVAIAERSSVVEHGVGDNQISVSLAIEMSKPLERWRSPICFVTWIDHCLRKPAALDLLRRFNSIGQRRKKDERGRQGAVVSRLESMMIDASKV